MSSFKILDYDINSEPGNVEHYFHFFWGYLLPIIDVILIDQKQNKIPPKGYLLRSCGSSMDPILHEIFFLLNIPYEIRKASELYALAKKNASGFIQRVDICGWDFYMDRKYLVNRLIATKKDKYSFRKNAHKIGFLGTEIPVSDLIKNHLDERSLFIKRLQNRLMPESLFVKKLKNIRQHFLKITKSTSFSTTELEELPFLLLKRAKQPVYYSQDGKAKISGYGHANRALLNLEEAKQEFLSQGINVEIYEPGSDSLSGQIRRFSSCRGIIAIRGAELANCIWMPPKSQVIVLCPYEMGPFLRLHHRIFKYLNLKPTQILLPKTAGNWPELNVNEIKTMINKN